MSVRAVSIVALFVAAGPLIAAEPAAGDSRSLMNWLLADARPAPRQVAASPMRDQAADQAAIDDPDAAHARLFDNDKYPSAMVCGECHPTHFRQWSVSQHAYAQLSPVFNAMHGEIVKRTNGTNGDFCIRCHTPVGMNLGEPQFIPISDRHPVSREGITCIVCHRVNQPYGKLSGRLDLVEGDITQPMYGPKGDSTELRRVIEQSGLTTERDDAGRQVHTEVKKFFQLTTSAHCGMCHDVTLVNGFRLEEAFSEYKNSPAAKNGVRCQDCHMGLEPGRILADINDPDFESKNFDFGPAARVGSLETKPRRLSNHMVVGPDYSILHPALFPINRRAVKEESRKDDPTVRGMATIMEWAAFDWKAGWGTDEFEDNASLDYPFPPRWQSIDDRYDARELIQENLELLKEADVARLKLLQNGYKLGPIVVDKADESGIRFKVKVLNGTDGHNVPTGFDAERLVWLFVQVFDAEGRIVHQSGDLDPNDDVRDLHSAYVHNHELPLDDQLFNLQSKFLTRNVRGGEREQVLAVNYSPSPLPFVRPERRSSVLLGKPGGARKHKVSIEPLGHRWAPYTVERKQLTGKGPYHAVVQLKAAMVPVNLINEIKGVGFDYGLSAADVAQTIVHGHVDKDGKTVIWREDSDDPADNKVTGHQILWERRIPLTVGLHMDK